MQAPSRSAVAPSDFNPITAFQQAFAETQRLAPPAYAIAGALVGGGAVGDCLTYNNGREFTALEAATLLAYGSAPLVIALARARSWRDPDQPNPIAAFVLAIISLFAAGLLMALASIPVLIGFGIVSIIGAGEALEAASSALQGEAVVLSPLQWTLAAAGIAALVVVVAWCVWVSAKFCLSPLATLASGDFIVTRSWSWTDTAVWRIAPLALVMSGLPTGLILGALATAGDPASPVWIGAIAAGNLILFFALQAPATVALMDLVRDMALEETPASAPHTAPPAQT